MLAIQKSTGVPDFQSEQFTDDAFGEKLSDF